MPSIDNVIGLLNKIESRDLSVHQYRCVRVRNRNAHCTRCADACTSGCIAYEDNELRLAPEKCVGCGTCATVCPTCAIEAKRPSDVQLYEQCRAAMEAADGVVVIACTRLCRAAAGLYDSRKVVAVECLGRVEESLLTRLVCDGASEIVLVQGVCDSCELETGIATAKQVCATQQELLSAWKSDSLVRIASRFPACTRKGSDQEYDASRRDFFLAAKDEAKSVTAVTADYAMQKTLKVEEEEETVFVKVAEDGTLPHFIPDRRERLLDALAVLGEPADVMVDTRLWGHVIIDAEKCTSCRMCATFCPTGALAKYRDGDGSVGVEYAPSDCVKCHCCEDICPGEALTLYEEVFAVDLLKGAVERFAMVEDEHPHGSPQSILYSLKGLFTSDQVYER